MHKQLIVSLVVHGCASFHPDREILALESTLSWSITFQAEYTPGGLPQQRQNQQ